MPVSAGSVRVLVGGRRRIERRRHWYGGGLLLAGASSFLFGPVVGAVVGPIFLGLFFALGFELSRPVSERPARDKVWAALVHGLAAFAVPCLVAVAVLSQLALPDARLFGKRWPWDVLVMLSVPVVATPAAIILASIHIHRRRGNPRLLQRLGVPALLLPGGYAIIALAMVVPEEFNLLGLLVALVAIPCVLVGLPASLAFLGLAAWRVFRPVIHDEAPAPGERPTFTFEAYRG